MKKFETKDLDFKFTEFDEEEGTFTGYASIFGIVDSYGDVVLPGAFKKTLREKKEFPMCWSHNLLEPIGIVRGEEDDKGLKIEGHINLDVQRGREVRSLMKQKAVKGISYGFQAVKEMTDKESHARQLKEINLFEMSPCVFQACPGAVVTGVKSADILEMAFGFPVLELELKPYPSEHSARLVEPGKFDEFRRKADGKLHNMVKVPATIDIIWGHLKDGEDDDWAAQALRFPVKDWTADEAKTWLKDNEVKYIDFEPAKEPEKSTPGLMLSKPDALHLLEAWHTTIKQARLNH